MAKNSEKKIKENKVHVFSYSQIARTDQSKSIELFAENTKLPVKDVATLAIQEEKENGTIYQYKINKITSAQFRSVMNVKIEELGGLVLDDKTFDSCWNSMCYPNQEDFEKLHKLQNDHKFILHIIAGTNELQHNYIQGEIKKFNSVPDINYTLSFEKKTADKKDLEQLARKYYSEENYEIIFHNEQSPKDAVSILANIYEPDSSDI